MPHAAGRALNAYSEMAWCLTALLCYRPAPPAQGLTTPTTDRGMVTIMPTVPITTTDHPSALAFAAASIATETSGETRAAGGIAPVQARGTRFRAPPPMDRAEHSNTP